MKFRVGALVTVALGIVLVWAGVRLARSGPATPTAGGGFITDDEWHGAGAYFLGIDADLDGGIDLVKIGFSQNVSSRPDDGRTFNPFPLQQLLVHPTETREEAQDVEAAYHRQFQTLEVELEDGGTEWFTLGDDLERFLTDRGARLERPVQWSKRPDSPAGRQLISE